jgi:hypothetical protein
LDSNEEDIKKQFKKFKDECPIHGITLMCDSLTGPIEMGIINFMVHCNGVMFFYKLVDCTGQSQNANYISEVNIFLLCHSSSYIKYVSLQHLKESTSQKIQKNLQFQLIFGSRAT